MPKDGKVQASVLKLEKVCYKLRKCEKGGGGRGCKIISLHSLLLLKTIVASQRNDKVPKRSFHLSLQIPHCWNYFRKSITIKVDLWIRSSILYVNCNNPTFKQLLNCVSTCRPKIGRNPSSNLLFPDFNWYHFYLKGFYDFLILWSFTELDLLQIKLFYS